MSENLTLHIDGKPVTVPRGTNVIEAAKIAGIEVPHYCYHPKLTIAGNCRMCLVDIGMPKLGADKKPEVGADGHPVINYGPKLQIACNTAATEGMHVQTRSPKVNKAREGVMEFLLVNHPLDCPICDQAGECKLQEFAFDYGKGERRSVETLVHKPKHEALGPKIVLDNERCIMCSRCERFMREVAHDDCLGFTQRGSHVELTCYKSEGPNTNYDLNIVDICPVGALTSVDFRFRQRVWFLKETKSVCTNCATGCNILISSREGVVHRQTPRENNAVNQCWMCDHGRLHYKFINDPRRITAPLVRSSGDGTLHEATWPEAITAVHEALESLQAKSKQSVAAIASARLSTEDLFCFTRWTRDELGLERIDCVSHYETGDDFLLDADRSPNTRGARLTGAATHPPGLMTHRIAADIDSGGVRGLIVFGENVTNCGISAAQLEKLEFLLVIDTLPNAVTERAHVVLPGATFAEKRGTFINKQWRIQRFFQAIEPRGAARAEWQIIASLAHEPLADRPLATVDDVMHAMARTIPALAGLSFSNIGDEGVVLTHALPELPPGQNATAPASARGPAA